MASSSDLSDTTEVIIRLCSQTKRLETWAKFVYNLLFPVLIVGWTAKDHWASIQESCHPCAHNWSAVIRIETMEEGSPLILGHLKPDLNINNIHMRHSNQDKEIRHLFIRTLSKYDDVKEIVDFFLEQFQFHMEMFGYGWNRTTNTAY